MKYQWGTVLPWWIQRYVFMRKGRPSPTLYKFDQDEAGNVVPAGGYAARHSGGGGGSSGSDNGGHTDVVKTV